MANNYLKHLEQKFAKKADELKQLGVEMDEQFKADGKFADGTQEKFDALLAECQNLKAEIENLQEVGAIERFRSGAKGEGGLIVPPARALSLGESFVASDAYKAAIRDGKIGSGLRASYEAKDLLSPYERKATLDTTGLDTRFPYVGGGVILLEQRRLTVAALLSQGQTTLSSVPFVKETSYTNGSGMVAEGGEKPEATFAIDDDTAPVKKIAVIAKVTDEMFADFPMMRDYVNNRLIYMIQAKEEDQILNGDGSGQNITGILSTTGVQSQALGGDTVPDAIHKAITKVRSVGFFEPDGIVIHPNDWQAVRLLKDSNNQYYGGGPFTGAYGVGSLAPNSLWGLPVVVTTAIAENTALVGAFRLGAQIWRRAGVTLEATNSNEDDFVYNKVSVRCEERLALTVYRPLAFCKVTGI